ncbi:hypothetical protein [Desulfosporosinus acidiphilus]|nr:hypothetical protein [Desulfosporosinus acidiphilus]
MPEMVKVKKIGLKEIEETLDTLMNSYGMSTECLSNLFGAKIDGH